MEPNPKISSLMVSLLAFHSAVSLSGVPAGSYIYALALALYVKFKPLVISYLKS